ncbi:hypothetical protein ABZT34_13805 [Streptomyces sp. NPDC005329]|uniref:hypothetical protein n=1 Tax=Streptomyces sp. NPDC005329 TaxID=3157034 RepID=UPI0033A2178B
MADDSTGDAGNPPASRAVRVTTAVRNLFASPARRDATAIIIGLISGGVGVFVGAAELPIWVLALLTVLVAALFLTVERAATADTADKKVWWLWWALAVALALPVGSWTYHVFFDSENRLTYPFFVEGYDQARILRSSGRPGADPQIGGYPMPVGETYDFECLGKDSEGAVWLKAVAGNYWYPSADLSPVGDFAISDMPTCD